jgi:hypothetical protein
MPLIHGDPFVFISGKAASTVKVIQTKSIKIVWTLAYIKNTALQKSSCFS